MESYARGYKMLHKGREILQIRHIPQSPSGDLKHKTVDKTLCIRQVLIHLLPDIGPKRRRKSCFIFPLFLLSSLGVCMGPLSKLRCCTSWPQVQPFKPAMLLSLEEDVLQRVKRCYERDDAVLVPSSRCYQGSCRQR